MEKNTYATSAYIDSPTVEVAGYLRDGANLGEYTLYSRMREQIDATTWHGTASGYPDGLYYHANYRHLGDLQIVEWHCGLEYGNYHHVYPMLLFDPEYFGSPEAGTYLHWISFVDPAKSTRMISEALPTIRRVECHSLKAELERRRGHGAPVRGDIDLRSNTVYVDAPQDLTFSYLADARNLPEWSHALQIVGGRQVDRYGRPMQTRLASRDLGDYQLIEYDMHHVDTGVVVRTPILIIPASLAFGRAALTGVILHRLIPIASSMSGDSTDIYLCDALNIKRTVEAAAGRQGAFAHGCSYLPTAAEASTDCQQ